MGTAGVDSGRMRALEKAWSEPSEGTVPSITTGDAAVAELQAAVKERDTSYIEVTGNLLSGFHGFSHFNLQNNHEKGWECEERNWAAQMLPKVVPRISLSRRR